MKNRIVFLTLITGFASCLHAQVDVPTANYDNNRTSANLNEWILNSNNVNPTQFGLLYNFPVDGQVYAQPLYLHALNMPGKGVLNVLFVATMHNSLYAFDADASTGTAPLWQVNFGVSIDPTSFDVPGATYTDILHEIGILGTPTIDRAGGTIYVVNETLLDGNMAFFLHALDLTTGAEKLNGPVQIQASVPGTGWGGSGDAVNGQLPLHPEDHIQRPGLLLANNTIYIGFGSHGDFAPWHGWIVAYNAADLQQQIGAFNTTPSAAGSSIWQGGRGLAADADGAVYCSTGNGNYDGVFSWGETVLHLTPTLEVADWFTPAQYAAWTDDDLDFGSNGPILVPGSNQVIAGGKAGVVALFDRTNMGHVMDQNTDTTQTFQAVPSGNFAIFNTALWNRPDGPILYVWGFHDPLRAFQIQGGAFNPTPLATNSVAQNALPFSGMTVSSNAFVPGTGIFWATTLVATPFPGAGTLRAFNALDISQELWNSDMQGNRDALGNFSKFVNPTVANGKVFVGTDSSRVAVYGLLSVPGIAAVVSAASFTSYSIAPGELVTIFGQGLGPSTPISLTLDGQGKVETSLGGMTVTFDGTPAPLVYASAAQINAVVPFGVAGKATTLMQVATPGGATYSATLAVSPTAPAVFVIGSGQGAILNGDLSVNSAANPAARGSSISIFATGGGVLNPPAADGTLVQAGHLPNSVAPVTVTIGGLPATVSYQGGAPGLVAGVLQINAAVPDGVTPGAAVPVAITAGGVAGLNTVTVAIK